MSAPGHKNQFGTQTADLISLNSRAILRQAAPAFLGDVDRLARRAVNAGENPPLIA